MDLRGFDFILLSLCIYSVVIKVGGSLEILAEMTTQFTGLRYLSGVMAQVQMDRPGGLKVLKEGMGLTTQLAKWSLVYFLPAQIGLNGPDPLESFVACLVVGMATTLYCGFDQFFEFEFHKMNHRRISRFGWGSWTLWNIFSAPARVIRAPYFLFLRWRDRYFQGKVSEIDKRYLYQNLIDEGKVSSGSLASMDQQLFEYIKTLLEDTRLERAIQGDGSDSCQALLLEPQLPQETVPSPRSDR